MHHAEAGEGQGKKPKAAPRFSAEDKQQAVNVHRVHLLCLLARALAMDQAASDPVVQVTSSRDPGCQGLGSRAQGCRI